MASFCEHYDGAAIADREIKRREEERAIEEMLKEEREAREGQK